MAWHVQPLSGGRWRVLTPSFTQACGIHVDEQDAVRAAAGRIADEGGGSVKVYSTAGEIDRTVTVAAGASPVEAAPALAD